MINLISLTTGSEEVGNVRSAGKNISREPIGSNTKIATEGVNGGHYINYLDSTLYKLYGDIVFIVILAFFGYIENQ